MRISRRTFVAGAATAICVGCSAGDTDPTDSPTERAEPIEPADPATAGGPFTTPQRTGFGAVITVGRAEDVLASIDASDGFFYVPEARAWLVRFPVEALEAAQDVYDPAVLPGMRHGLLALHQKCTHLGCRVPACASSQRFECPCHVAIFNRVGEHISGPAPRGLDQFPVQIVDGWVAVDTATIVVGVDVGISTVMSDAAGPSCI